jgi:hypothetical protein
VSPCELIIPYVICTYGYYYLFRVRLVISLHISNTNNIYTDYGYIYN